MKRYTLIFSLLLCIISGTRAQGSGNISYFPVVTGKDVPEAAQKLLVAKMEQIVTKSGYGSANRADRFVFVAKCNVTEKDVAPVTPPRIRQEVEITFMLGDVVENKVYATASLNLKGMGINETKVWQTAINGIKVDNPVFPKLFSEANGKIEIYYRDNCQGIISKARALASTGKFDEAIASLMEVPEICSDCYNNALNEACKIYQEKIDNEGASLITKARNTWSASMDQKGADAALVYIHKIDPQSSAFGESDTLVKEISNKLSTDKARDWEMKIKKYKVEKEFKRREQANSHSRSMATIAACRSVAEKWAENQSQTKMYLNW